MVFSSEIFLFYFLPLVLLLYIACSRNVRMCNLVLLAASIIFYSWGGVQYCILLMISTAVNYTMGILIDKKRQYGKYLLALAVIFDIGILAVFKYANFITENVNVCLDFLGSDKRIYETQIVLPIGISFFTFQILSYVIDVYYKKVNVQKNILDLGLYIILFPQLIAGPIVRYIDVNQELRNRKFCWDNFYLGIKRFSLGFAKKVLLANQVAIVADTAFNYEWGLHPFYAWIGAISYMLQIYLDFSAYSDMAIGLGLMFGFHFNENFNYPYISCSIKEFWRRWHISLSTWFRDYVYIPLGGNRNGKIKTYRNLLIVFFLTGLWHGASWNFVLWGLYHGFFLLLERITGFCSKMPKWLSYAYTIFVVLIGWVLFRADNLQESVRYIGNMFGVHMGSISNVEMMRQLDMEYVFFFIASCAVSAPIFRNNVLEKIPMWVKDALTLGTFFIAICYMVASDYNPFIYFRF